MNAETLHRRSGGRPVHDLVPQIEKRWLAAKSTSEKPSPKAIYDELRKDFKDTYPSLRTVEVHSKRLFAKHGPGLIKPAFWRQRLTDAEPRFDSETIAYLLQLQVISDVVYKRLIYTTEAAWGARLRVALRGLDLFIQLLFVREYALREWLAPLGLRPEIVDTRTLDAIVAFRPWASDAIPRGDMDGLTPVFVDAFQQRGDRSELYRWVERSISGQRGRDRITLNDILAAARAKPDYSGSPWELSDALFAGTKPENRLRRQQLSQTLASSRGGKSDD